jgi:hypothetical protein
VRLRDEELRKQARVTEQEASVAMHACCSNGKAKRLTTFHSYVYLSTTTNDSIGAKKAKRMCDTVKVVLGLEPTG